MVVLYISTVSTNQSVVNCSFVNNFANNGLSGAIMNNGVNHSISGSNFTSNVADIGDVIYNNESMTLHSNVMLNNMATLGHMIYNNGNMGVLNLTYLKNSTINVVRGLNVTLLATLTDDRGNTVTGQNISFYIDGVFLANVTSIEGDAKLNYLVNQEPNSIISITGDYGGHNGYSIMVKNGELLIKTIPKEPEEKENPEDPEIPEEIEDPEIPEDSEINNKTSNNNPTIKTSSAAMKPTGMPIIAVVLVLLASLGIIYRKQ